MHWSLYREYYERFWKAVLRRVFHLWKAQVGIGAATAAVGIYVSNRVGLTPDKMVTLTLEASLISYLVVMGLCTLVAIIASPVVLDSEQQSAVTARDHRILELEQQLVAPGRSAAEEHFFQRAKAILDSRGEDARTVLQHLQTHGNIAIGHFAPPLPSGMTFRQLVNILRALQSYHLVSIEHRQGMSGTEEVFSIAPGFSKALEELLYPG